MKLCILCLRKTAGYIPFKEFSKGAVCDDCIEQAISLAYEAVCRFGSTHYTALDSKKNKKFLAEWMGK